MVKTFDELEANGKFAGCNGVPDYYRRWLIHLLDKS
jgi:hypothetical protein